MCAFYVHGHLFFVFIAADSQMENNVSTLSPWSPPQMMEPLHGPFAVFSCCLSVSDSTGAVSKNYEPGVLSSSRR